MYPLTPEQIATYDQDWTAQYVAGMAVCTVMVVVSMVLRLYAQYLVRTLGALDNYLIILSCVCRLRRSSLSKLEVYDGKMKIKF
jgi:cobalamin biosynthesis protein CobD/CbiB